MLIKIIGIGIICVVLSLILKGNRPEFALLVSVCGALVIFGMVFSGLEDVLNTVFNISDLVGLNGEIFTPIIKVVGVGYITEFVSDIAEDSGNKLLANKMVLGGKVAICIIALPIVQNLINAIFSVIL